MTRLRGCTGLFELLLFAHVMCLLSFFPHKLQEILWQHGYHKNGHQTELVSFLGALISTRLAISTDNDSYRQNQ